MPAYFLSTDWGTSSLRVRLAEYATARVLAESSNDSGISVVHQLWLKAALPEAEREAFYLNFLQEPVRQIMRATGLTETPAMMMSGMASANIGLKPLDYAPLPLAVDGSGLVTYTCSYATGPVRELILVSGACSANDVMRGEEVQLIGSVQPNEEALYIFPGTHSKHIRVANDRAVTLSTFMTGELFDILSVTGLLSASVAIEKPVEGPVPGAFLSGVRCSTESALSNALFAVRVNQLFNRYSKMENAHFLSGVLIGSELSYLQRASGKICLVGNSALLPLYEAALGLINPLLAVSGVDGGEAIVKGHTKIMAALQRDHISH